jgi:SAM-dependent methyltransferase
MNASEAKTTWGLGEYRRMADRLQAAAELAVARVDVARRDRVLDVACGTGNAALVAARRGAQVAGVDLEPVLIEQARDRALAAGLQVDWREGDAGALPFADREFSVVLSVFGVMYVADQTAAARELARVCAPGARMALTAWAPDSFMAAMGAALAAYLPAPPPGADPPSRWGEEESLEALLSPAGIALHEATRESVALEFSDRVEAIDFLVSTAGHVLAERRRLADGDQWQSLLADLGTVVDAHSIGAGRRLLTLEYLLAVGRAEGGGEDSAGGPQNPPR